MSWVEWLKGIAERLPGADGGDDHAPRAPVKVRSPRKGGEAYAREWVKVLEETGPNRDPSNTYTWELNTDPGKTGSGRAVPPGKPAQPAPVQDPFDTYTWELQESDSPEDPWGLKNGEEAPARKVGKQSGVNPYDTGVFDATWTGRFDQR
jgi:hypothetical protein